MRRVIQIISILCVTAGIIVIAYPFVVSWNYGRAAHASAVQFEVTAQSQQQNPLLQALYERMQQENKRLYDDGQKELKDPFSYAVPGINLEEYGIEDRVYGYLVIDKIEENLPIYFGANEENMSLGAAHLTETSYPIGGPNTNTVVAAHRGYFGANMFRRIDELEKGDSVDISTFWGVLHYKVTDIEVILPDEVSRVLIRKGKDMVTLMSCHPYGQNAHRILVYCERVTE